MGSLPCAFDMQFSLQSKKRRSSPTVCGRKTSSMRLNEYIMLLFAHTALHVHCRRPQTKHPHGSPTNQGAASIYRLLPTFILPRLQPRTNTWAAEQYVLWVLCLGIRKSTLQMQSADFDGRLDCLRSMSKPQVPS